MFALDVEDGWPPAGSEGVWCEFVEKGYKLVNAPFFISGLAYGDLFTAEKDEVNEHIFEFEVVEESGHSLVWLMNLEDANIESELKRARDLGCNTEGLDQLNYHAIDVPPHIDVKKFDKIIDSLESKGVATAFPVWRLEE
jgi:hypothetical protein